MNQKVIRFTCLFFIIQLCLVVGFPTQDPPKTEGVKPLTDKATEEVAKAAEGAAKAAEGVAKDAEGAAKAAEGIAKDAEGAAKAAEGVAKDAEGAAKAVEADAKAGIEEISKVPTPSADNLPSGGNPPLSPEVMKALMLGLQSSLNPSTSPLNPANTSADTKNQPTQLLNLLSANSNNPEFLANIIKNVPNPTQFAKSLFAWLQPASQIGQNTINGLMDIHMKNRQPGVELMRTISEPGVMLARALLAPTPFGPQVDKMRSLTMKGISDNMDNFAQGSKVLFDAVPQGMQSFHTQANGLIDMAPLSF